MKYSPLINNKVHLDAYLYIFTEVNRSRVKEMMNMKGSKKEYGPFEFLLMEMGGHVRFLNEGKAKGKTIAFIAVKRLMANEPIDQIAKDADMTIEEVEQIKRELQLN